MATAKKPQKPRRKFRTAPTLREQAAKGPATPKRATVASVLLMPFRAIGQFITRVAHAVHDSTFGKVVSKIVARKHFAPVRFIGRILSKILLISYFKNSFKELRLVVWPDRRLTWRLTFAVTVFAIAFGLFIAGLDFVFEKAFREVLLGK